MAKKTTNKTVPSEESVEGFINSLPDEQTRQDCFTLVDIMKEASKAEPKLWGGSIVAFGKYHYKYASGHEGDSALIGFSPRKQNLTLYVLMPTYMSGGEAYKEMLAKLGKHTTGKACLYIKRLSDVHLPTLKRLIRQSVKDMKKMYPDAKTA